MRAFVKQVEIVIAEQKHLRAPRQYRPFFGFARHLAERGAASWGVPYWLLEHFGEQFPPRDPRDSQARYSPYSWKETAKLAGKQGLPPCSPDLLALVSSSFDFCAPCARSPRPENRDPADRQYRFHPGMPGTAACHAC